MKILQLIILSAVVFILGCAIEGRGASGLWGNPVARDRQQLVRVKVDSLATPTAKDNHTYVLLPGNEGVTLDDLQFQEFASYLTRALNYDGFVFAKNVNDADVAIVLSYGIGDPQVHLRTYRLPLFGQTGVSSASTYGTASTFGNFTSYSGTTTYTPQFGIVGYTKRVESNTTYIRHAVITAYDLKEYKATKKQKQLWRTTLTSDGPSDDLREIFPFLIGAAVPLLGENSHKQLHLDIYDDDPNLRLIKNEIKEKTNSELDINKTN